MLPPSRSRDDHPCLAITPSGHHPPAPRRRHACSRCPPRPHARRAPPTALTLAGRGGWFQTAFDTTVLGAFRKTHPDIAVFYYPSGDAFQTLGLLREQRASPSTDVVLLETGVATRATTEGLLVPLDAGTMPVIKDLIPSAVMPGTAGPALILDSLALGYSPARATQAPRRGATCGTPPMAAASPCRPRPIPRPWR